MKKRMGKQSKTLGSMTTAELAVATAKYDTPFGGWDGFKALEFEDRKIHQFARRPHRVGPRPKKTAR